MSAFDINADELPAGPLTLQASAKDSQGRGWLNRHLLTSTGHGPVRAVSIGDNLPRILRGKAPAFALHGIADLSLPSVAKGDDGQRSGDRRR